MDSLEQPASRTFPSSVKQATPPTKEFADLNRSGPHPGSFRSRETLAFLLALGACLADILWVRQIGNIATNLDEATIGLMARHILEGERPLFFYNQGYLGSIDAFIAAGFFSVFGSSVESLRIAPSIYFVLFALLYLRFFGRSIGARTTILGLVVLALPVTYLRPIISMVYTSFGLITTLGFLAITLADGADRDWEQGRRRVLGRAFALGLIAGVATYVLALSLVYLVTAVGLFLLSPIQSAGIRVNRSRHRAGWRALGIGVIVASALSLSLTLFLPTCAEVPAALNSVAAVAPLVFLASVVIGVGGFLILGYSRLLLVSLALMAVGAGIGFLPELLFRVQTNETGTNAQWSCISAIPAKVRSFPVDYLGPLYGAQAIRDVSETAASRPQDLLLVAVVSLAVVATLLKVIKAASRLLRGDRMSTEEKAWLVIGGLFFGNCLLIMVTDNAIDLRAIRYLAVAWTVSGILLANLVVGISRRSRPVGLLILGFWLVFGGVGNFAQSLVEANRRTDWFPNPVIAEMVEFSAAHGATVGYSEASFARILTFLSRERLVLLPYNGAPYYEPFIHRLSVSGREAWIIPFDSDVPVQSRDIAALTALLRRLTRGGFTITPERAAALADAEVVARSQFGIYDVWIIE